MAVDLNIPVLQIVGFQNSGKTTLVEKLVKKATAEGLHVATIKHHGHGGKPESVNGGKDSERHRLAGAIATTVEGDGVLHLSCQKNKWQLNEILNIYKLLPIDMVFVEGYKMENYPKVVLLRTEEDIELVDKLSNIIAVISWFTIEETIKKKYRIYSLEKEDYLNDILQVVRDLHE